MKKHNVLWWFFIGWWWRPITLPLRLLAVLIKRAKSPAETPKPMNSTLEGETHKVAGTSFRQDAIKTLGTKNPDFAKTKRALQDAGLTDEWVYEYEFAPQKVELLPEPDNPHDPKAIKVVVDGVHVGYIKAGSCAHVHKLLESDRIQRITCFIGGGKSKGLFPDGEGEYVLEQDEIPFHARLTITTT